VVLVPQTQPVWFATITIDSSDIPAESHSERHWVTFSVGSLSRLEACAAAQPVLATTTAAMHMSLIISLSYQELFDITSGPCRPTDEEFDAVAEAVLRENAELYRRLA
jgi:hypothetical protein